MKPHGGCCASLSKWHGTAQGVGVQPKRHARWVTAPQSFLLQGCGLLEHALVSAWSACEGQMQCRRHFMCSPPIRGSGAPALSSDTSTKQPVPAPRNLCAGSGGLWFQSRPRTRVPAACPQRRAHWGPACPSRQPAPSRATPACGPGSALLPWGCRPRLLKAMARHVPDIRLEHALKPPSRRVAGRCGVNPQPSHWELQQMQGYSVRLPWALETCPLRACGSCCECMSVRGTPAWHA